MNSSPDLAADAAKMTTGARKTVTLLGDPRAEPGPTLDDRIQVFEGRHLAGSLVALAGFAFTLFWVIAHWK